jgi:hypothetical protein
VEKECLRILLCGPQPIIICPARSLENLRLPADWKAPLAGGRLLILSCFPAAQRRATADLAARRNELVAALADDVWFAHIAPGGPGIELERHRGDERLNVSRRRNRDCGRWRHGYRAGMSFNEVLAELPTLTPAQRQAIMRRALELDESPLSTEHEALVEERLAAHRGNPASAISLDEMAARLRSRFSK